MIDKIMKILGRKPYRCRGCHNRFYVFIPRVKEYDEGEFTAEELEAGTEPEDSEESTT